MYENQDFNTIMERMLNKVSPSINKDEGSFVYTALAPVAVEHEKVYTDMDQMLLNAFADTADREHLIRKASEVGLTPHKATAASWSAELSPDGMQLLQGARFNCGEVNLYVSGKTEKGLWILTSETAGTMANKLNDDIIPIDYIGGFEDMTLVDLIVAGTDEENTEDFRNRYLTYMQTPAASGNQADYYNWAMAVDGVGAAKVQPLASGPGTVKVIITDDKKRAATSALIDKVAEYIEQRRPIGAAVTVVSGAELTIDASASIVLKEGATLDTVREQFSQKFTEYLQNGAFKMSYVGIAYTGNLLIDSEGVEDYSELKLNGGTKNILLQNDEIAVCGRITLEVSG